jgi:hypothetical protein
MSILAYDAVFAMARAWHEAIEVRRLNVTQTPSLALAALKATNFSALSGAYAFDAQLNRKVDYDFMQPQNGVVVKIGSCRSATTFEIEVWAAATERCTRQSGTCFLALSFCYVEHVCMQHCLNYLVRVSCGP